MLIGQIAGGALSSKLSEDGFPILGRAEMLIHFLISFAFGVISPSPFRLVKAFVSALYQGIRIIRCLQRCGADGQRYASQFFTS